MEEYTLAEIEVVNFNQEDVIATSNGDPNGTMMPTAPANN